MSKRSSLLCHFAWLSLLFLACSSADSAAEKSASAPEQKPSATAASNSTASQKPVNAPQLFMEGLFNTDADEYGPAFAPDGKTFYFTKRVNRRNSEFIQVSRLENGKWSAPLKTATRGATRRAGQPV